MGKGDKKTAKGKRVMGSYGVTRKRKSTKSTVVVSDKPKKEAKAAEPTAKKTVTKAATEKKTTTKKPAAKKPATKKVAEKKAEE